MASRRRWLGAVLGVVVLGMAVHDVAAEIIKRINPDGSVTLIVPQKAPSGGGSGPCGVEATHIRTRERASETYGSILAALRLDPGNVACRQTLAVVGRLAGVPEAAIANDLNASSAGANPLPMPETGAPPGAAPAP